MKLSPGMNIIEAPNEWGKSTWSAFLAAMFYGIDTSQRDRKGVLADKNKFQPWNGAPMSGTLRCVVDGREMVIERTGKRTGAPMSQFSAWYADTGEPVPGLTGENVGVSLLGVEREVFLRSGFIGPAGLSVTQTPELERRIAALVSSGEDTSFSEPFAQLNAWKNRRKHNRTGLLPETMAELHEVEQALDRMEQSRTRMLQAQDTLQTVERRQREVEEALRQWEVAEQQKGARKHQAAQQALLAEAARRETIQREKDRLPSRDALRQGQAWSQAFLTRQPLVQQQKQQICRLRDVLSQKGEQTVSAVFQGMTPAQAQTRAQMAAERWSVLEKQGAARLPVLCFILLLAAGLGIIAGITQQSPVRWVGLIAALLCAGGGGGVLLSRRRKQAEVRKEQAALLHRYQAKTPGEILFRAVEYEQQMTETSRLEQQLLELETQVEQAEAEDARLCTRLFQLTAPFAPEAQTASEAQEACGKALETWSLWEQASRQMETLKAQLEAVSPNVPVLETEGPAAPPAEPKAQLEAESKRLAAAKARCQEIIAMAKGEQAVGGEPEVLTSRQETLLARRESLEEEYDALLLAQKGLEEAHRALQSRFSPALNQRAGSWMKRLTGGKYQDLRLDKNFEAQVRGEGDTISRSSLTLSAGTVDQLYLAVRLAICDLALPKPQAVPLVLDDALVRFDDTRFTFALDALWELAQTRQILLFTCHGREGAYLEHRAGVHVLRPKAEEIKNLPQNAAEWR